MTIQLDNVEEFPPMLTTGMITHRLLISVTDSLDSDKDPDIVAVPGEVVFRANVDYITTLDGQGNPVTVGKGPIRGVYDNEGYLCTTHPNTLEPMYRGVNLHASDDPNASVKDYSWTGTFNLKSVNGTLLRIPPAIFIVPAGSTQDLSEIVKIPATPGWGLPQTELSARRAEAAALESAQFSEDSKAAALEAAKAAEVAQGVKEDADAGLFDGLPGDLTPAAPISVWEIPASALPSTLSTVLTDNWALTLPTPSAGKSGTISLVLTQDSSGGHAVSWPPDVRWSYGVEPALSGPGRTDLVHLFWTGEFWVGLMGGVSLA